MQSQTRGVCFGWALVVCLIGASCAAPPAWVQHHDRARQLRRAGKLRAANEQARLALAAGGSIFDADPCAEAEARISLLESRIDLGDYQRLWASAQPIVGLLAGGCPDASQAMVLRGRLSELAVLSLQFSLAGELLSQVEQAVEKLGDRHPARAAEALLGASAVPAIRYDQQGAVRLLERALAFWGKTPAPDVIAFGIGQVALGRTLTRLNRLDEAEAMLRRALEFMRAELGPQHPFLIQALLALARLEIERRDFDQAAGRVQRAQRIGPKHLAPTHPMMTDVLRVQADILARRGELEAASVSLSRALSNQIQQFGAEHPFIASTLFELAALHHIRGEPDKAQPLLKQALGLWRTRLGEQNPATWKIKLALGMVHLQAGQALKAEMLARDVIERQASAPVVSPGDARGAWELLGRACHALGKSAEAWRASARAVSLAMAEQGPESLQVAQLLEFMAGVAGKIGHPAEAADRLERALTIRRKRQGDRHIEVGRILVKLSGTQFLLGRLDQAEQELSEALSIIEQTLGPLHLDLAEPLGYLAEVLIRAGRSGEAEPHLRRALGLVVGKRGRDRQRRVLKGALVRALRASGKADEATALERELSADP
jgi:tetratricopeptide (TPR) repeat protein